MQKDKETEEKKAETKRGKDRETEMEEGSHRCGGASGDTSHYGVNCSSGDVGGESREVTSSGCVKQYMHAYTHTHTHRGNRENIWICATCLEEVI